MPNTEAILFIGWNAGAGKRLDRAHENHRGRSRLQCNAPVQRRRDDADEIIAKTTDHHTTLIGGHHRLAVAASLGKRLFWRDTGEPVKLDLFFKHHGSS